MKSIELISIIAISFAIVDFRCEKLLDLDADYDKNTPPSRTDVAISLYVNRISAVDENKEEITLDIFLRVYWQDTRIRIIDNKTEYLDATWDKRHEYWVPDLYIRQLKEMKILTLFQEMAAIRLYKNKTLRISLGATIVLKCDMDFRLYPLDVQTCVVDFSSYKYSISRMKFRWRDESPLTFSHDFHDNFRLPRYVVSFVTQPDTTVIYYGEHNHSAARLTITLSREIRIHLFDTYLPSSLFVFMSWGGFIIIPEIVPGRIVLMVTMLLSLITMFDTVRNNSPSSLELKCIDVWLISCTLFVFTALIEYFIVLYGIRCDKNWRHTKRKLNRRAIRNGNGDRKKNSVENVEDAEHNRTADVNAKNTKKTKNIVLGLRTLARRMIPYCGSERGSLDRISLRLFPLCFFLFAVSYWFLCLSEANRIYIK